MINKLRHEIVIRARQNPRSLQIYRPDRGSLQLKVSRVNHRHNNPFLREIALDVRKGIANGELLSARGSPCRKGSRSTCPNLSTAVVGGVGKGIKP
jgi:hypothetical protein